MYGLDGFGEIGHGNSANRVDGGQRFLRGTLAVQDFQHGGHRRHRIHVGFFDEAAYSSSSKAHGP